MAENWWEEAPLAEGDWWAEAPVANPETGLVEQTMSGVNEGIAAIAGFPVDIVNSLFTRPRIESEMTFDERGIPQPKVTSVSSEGIDNPVGGSQMFRDLLAPTISETQPQTTAQRYGRRIGQEVGAMSVPGGAMLRTARAPLAVAGTEAASALGSGVAGQTSREIAPESDTSDLIASLLGGVSPVGASRALRPGPSAPSMDELRRQQAAAYGAVDASQARLSPQNRQDIIDRLSNTADSMEMDQFLHPRAARTLDRMESLEPAPRIADVEKKRRLIGRDVAGSMDPSESSIGSEMKNQMDDYLSGLAQQGQLGPDANETLEQLQTGRQLTSRIKKAETVDELLTKAIDRAGSTGTSGNEVNAIRQNLRSILDNPKKRRQFSSEELGAIRDIVRGTPTVNAARLLGRLSPTSGALPLITGIGGTTLGASVGGPVGTAVGMSTMLAGSAGKGLAEAMTRRQVDNLLRDIRYGGKVPGKGGGQDDLSSLIAALLSQSAAD